MSKFRLILTGFIPFLVFIGCGQHFEATSMSVQEAEKTMDATNLDVPEGKTPKSVDQQILDTYMSEFDALDNQSIESLVSDIRSFEIQVDRRQNQVNGVSVRMHSRTSAVDSLGTSITACNNLISIRDSQITLARLQSQNSIFVGRSAGYEIMIQCTDSNCDEMVAAIRRTENGSRGLILMGLKGGSITGGRNGSYTQRYISRHVDIEPYFTVAVSPNEYIAIVCSLVEPPSRPNQGDNTQNESVDPTDGIFETDPAPTGQSGEDTPVNPVEGSTHTDTDTDQDETDSFWFDIGDTF